MANKRKTAKVSVEKLADRRQCVITLDMTELNFQRLACLLLFADHFEIDEKVADGPLPWEEAIPLPEPKELEIDYEAVRRAIIKQAERITANNAVNGADGIRAAVKRNGGSDLASVPKGNLLQLLADLEAHDE